MNFYHSFFSNSALFLLLLFPLSTLSSDDYLPACTTAGNFIFKAGSADLTITNFQGTIAACRYEKAPTITFTGSDTDVTFVGGMLEFVAMRGVLKFDDGAKAVFRGGLGLSGSASQLAVLNGARVSVLNSTAITLSSVTAIALEGKSQLDLESAVIESRSAVESLITVKDSSVFNCQSCAMKMVSTQLQTQSSMAWSSGSCVTANAYCLRASGSSTATLSSLLLQSQSRSKFMLVVDGYSSVSALKAKFDGPIGIAVRTFASVSCKDCEFKNALLLAQLNVQGTLGLDGGWYSGMMTGSRVLVSALTVAGRSVVSLSNGFSISNQRALYGGAISLTGDSKAFCSGNASLSLNSASYGGAVSLDQGSAFTSQGCSFSHNTAREKGGAIYSRGGSIALQQDNSFFANRAYLMGGGIAMEKGVSELLLQGRLMAAGNTARSAKEMLPDGRGGFLALADTCTVQVDSLLLENSDNQAPRGSFMDIDGTMVEFRALGNSSSSATTSETEGIFIADLKLAKSYASNPPAQLKAAFPGLLMHSNAVGIKVLYPAEGSQITLYVNSTIPSIQVAIIDVFNQTQTWIGRKSLVSVKIVDVSGSLDFLQDPGSGQKALLDAGSGGVLEFSDLAIRTHIVKNYHLKVVASGFDVDALAPKESNLTQWPSILLSFKTCNPSTEKVNPDALAISSSNDAKIPDDLKICLPKVYINQGARTAFWGLAIVAWIAGAATILGLIVYRHETLIRINSLAFLMLAAVGSCFAFTSLLFGSVGQAALSSNCNVTYWLENLGFTMVFGAIYGKCFRLQQFLVFKHETSDSSSWSVSRLDRMLFKWFTVLLLVMMTYLAFWHAFYPSTYTETLIPNSQIAMDRCEPGVFGKCLFYIKIMVQLAAIVFSHNVSRPSDGVNREDIVLRALCYLWLVFGGIFGLAGQWSSAVNVDTEFALKQFSILVPQTLTLILLCGWKVGVCAVQRKRSGQTHNLRAIARLNDDVDEGKKENSGKESSVKGKPVAVLAVKDISDMDENPKSGGASGKAPSSTKPSIKDRKISVNHGIASASIPPKSRGSVTYDSVIL